MIAGGCKHCGGTAGSATVPNEPQAHAICHFLALRNAPTPCLGNVCPCCKGSGCHPRSAVGPVNPNQDRIERWAPACRTCKGSGAVGAAGENRLRQIDRDAKAKLHWYERCAETASQISVSSTNGHGDP